ncbi:ABC transporter ATP-binding protein [Haloimpatiens lingqiaonensis]|uniref:ABC transporter ATP-binding protein n=1 Tax=Haloimpatiens lingqiaonensis TaxID=1380675 RepID=UPI0010FF5102|nr:ABC transporter ATP-binding protein [Haloimpatiens lingqiaonensis]
METLKVNNLTFAYSGSTENALRDINFSVESGDFITICGRSGCGKSTLLRHLKPALTPAGTTKGNILYKGKDIKSIDLRSEASSIGYVLQNPDNQVVTDKVWHELAFGLESLGYDRNTIRSRVAEMASFFGIQTWFTKSVTELSGGQKQLLNLASIMVMQPDMLLLDEPTSQLDPIATVDFLNTIKRVNIELGTTIIIVEHHLDDVLPLSDRVIVMDKGEIVGDTTPNKIGSIIYGKNEAMFNALPIPMRLAVTLGSHENPVTIKEGRRWLNSYLNDQYPNVKDHKLDVEACDTLTSNCDSEIAASDETATICASIAASYDTNSTCAVCDNNAELTSANVNFHVESQGTEGTNERNSKGIDESSSDVETKGLKGIDKFYTDIDAKNSKVLDKVHPYESAKNSEGPDKSYVGADSKNSEGLGKSCVEVNSMNSKGIRKVSIIDRIMGKGKKIEKDKSIIELNEVWFRYEKNGQDIIKDLSLEVDAGEIYSIVGGNGTGKTTMLRLIAGLCQPYRGTVKYNDVDVFKKRETILCNNKIVLMPQNPQALFVKKTVELDLKEVLKGRGIKKAEANEKLEDIIKYFGIESLLKRHPYDLSGGEQQIVAMAKILMLSPKVLLLDEPTKALDSFFKYKLGAIIKKLKQDGVTIIIVSHDLDFCAEYSDKCSMFFNGTIVSTDEPGKFFKDNSFYTTSLNRLTRGILNDVTSYKEVISICRKRV